MDDKDQIIAKLVNIIEGMQPHMIGHNLENKKRLLINRCQEARRYINNEIQCHITPGQWGLLGNILDSLETDIASLK
jgi:hypothetical protein